jgi:hypothetical protein
MEGDKVRLPDKFIKRGGLAEHAGEQFFFNMGVRYKDTAKTEALNLFPKGPARGPKPHNAQGTTGHTPDGLVQVPAALPDAPILKRDAPDPTEEHSQGVFRHFFGTVTGDIGYPNAPFFSRQDIHIIVSNPVTGNNPTVPEFPDNLRRHRRLIKQYPVGVRAGPDYVILTMAIGGKQIRPEARKNGLFFVIPAKTIITYYNFHCNLL